MPGKKKLITPTQAARLERLASTDPDAAITQLKKTIAVRTGIDLATKFSIDAIKNSTRRKRPLQQTGSLDQEFSGDADRLKMIATARDIFINFSFATGLIRSHIKNVIGRGPRLQMTTEDDDYNEKAEKYFRARKNLIDVRGMPFNTALRVGEAREMIDGDYGTALVKGGQVQYIEGDRIADPPGTTRIKSHIYVNGVEMKRDGEIIAYHVHNRGKRQGTKTYKGRIEKKDFIHSFRPERFDQARGVCWLLSAVNDLQDLRETLESTKGTWKLQNMLGLAITSDTPEDDPLTSLLGQLSTYSAPDASGSTAEQYEVNMAQGVTSFELTPGQKIEAIQSKTPNTTFEPFTMLLIRIISLTLDMPLEIALQFFSRGGYSAHRAALLQYSEAIKARREEIEQIKLDRLVGWMLRRAIKAGGLQGPKKDIDPVAHVWQWPGMGLLDPDKQRKGDKEGYNLGVESIASIAGRDGTYWQDQAKQRIKEIVWISKAAKAAEIDPRLVLPITAPPGSKPVGETEPVTEED